MPLYTRSDFRDAARGLARTPSVSLAAIVCLALGLGVTTAVSSAINRALLQPPPFRDPGRLVTVYRTAPQANTWPFSAPNYLDLARQSHQLSELAAGTGGDGLLVLPGQALQPTIFKVTGNLFPMLGVSALVGRLLTPDDDRPGAPRVAVFSEPFWRQHFGGDPSIVGRTIHLGGDEVTVIGIAPPDFRFIQGTRVLRADIWLPMRFTTQQLESRGTNFLLLVGRLAPDATVASAQAELTSTYRALSATYPQMKGESVRVVPLEAESVRAVRTPLLLVFAAACMVLLIAASNVASLLLARGVQRRREIAIRAALGGGRWAVVRPILAESVMLTGVGLLAGLGLAWAGVRTIGVLAERQVPQLKGLTMDLRVVALAVALGVVVAALCGVLPAWRNASVDPQEALRGGRGGGAGREQHRALAGLVAAEVALSLMLLIAASLVLRGFTTVLHNDPGFETARVLTLSVSISPDAYPDSSATRRFLHPALDAIRAEPGVASAGAIDLMPYVNWGDNFNIRYEGQPGDNFSKLPLVEYRNATRGFFDVTGQRLLSGRLFGPTDYQSLRSPTVVVANAALAKRDFKDESPIGKRFYIGDTTFATIVGVVSDIRNAGPFAPAEPEVYYPYDLGNPSSTSYAIAVRANSGDPTALEAEVRAAIHALDPGAAVSGMMAMNDVIAQSMGQPRFYLTLLGVFALVAVVLALAGLYGVMSYAVMERTREIGIRSALGSPAPRIVALVARQGVTVVGLGVLVGLLGGAVTTRLLTGMLYGVSAADPPSWAVATVALILAGLAASVLPARRAIRVDPLIAMRVD
ncbi:MAG TPA: ABC transporter permease [Gemmatimonadaceae bacterium]|nr:ABC transporter permease [Gemmatimonadaceae bacterium]